MDKDFYPSPEYLTAIERFLVVVDKQEFWVPREDFGDEIEEAVGECRRLHRAWEEARAMALGREIAKKRNAVVVAAPRASKMIPP